MKSSTDIRDLVKNLVPKYKVNIHKDVNRFIDGIAEPERKKLAQEFVNDLENYPELLDRWDIEKIKGRDNTYRLRIGRYRIAFVVNKTTRQIEVPDATVK